MHADPDKTVTVSRCARRLGTTWPNDGRTVKELMVGDERLETVPEFRYLGDVVFAGGGVS